MKKHLLILSLLALAGPAAAQHIELSGRAGVGLFQYGGPSAGNSSSVNCLGGPEDGYTNSPYGSRWGAGVALGGRVQRVGASKGLLALDLGYEWLRSRTLITSLYISPGTAPSGYAGEYRADGATSLQTQNLTAFFGMGRRFDAGSVVLDVLAGPEGAYVFGFHEKGSGTFDGGAAWTTDRDHRATNRADVRLRADATAWYQRVGFNASYSYGLLNYQSGLLGSSREVYSRTLRLGLAYRLR